MSLENSNTIELTKTLVSKASVTPDDADCQALMIERLAKCGFNSETMVFEDVTNLWARRGTEGPLLVFAGHTDVVPTGPLEQWRYDPFIPTIEDGMLYGRGTADMKGSLAAFITACERFVRQHPDHKGSIAFLITSDEEGPAVNGTVKVVETLEKRSEKIDWCLVGEPSSTEKLGDIVKNGRRGSLNGKLHVIGKQGHVAYPHLAENPIHAASAAMAELCAMHWDNGNEFFPETSFQITNFHSGTGATNVIPGHVDILFNFRFSTESTAEQLKSKVEAVLDAHKLRYELTWNLSGEPFLTPKGELVQAAQQAIKSVMGYETQLSTSGGTSDGRFIAPTGAQVLELGPLNASIHQVNEHVSVDDLNKLSEIYEQMLVHLLVD